MKSGDIRSFSNIPGQPSVKGKGKKHKSHKSKQQEQANIERLDSDKVVKPDQDKVSLEGNEEKPEKLYVSKETMKQLRTEHREAIDKKLQSGFKPGEQKIDDDEDDPGVSDFVKNTNVPLVTDFDIYGKGDLCLINDPYEINIIHTNDLHGKLANKKGRGGMDYVAGKIDDIRKEDVDYLLVDAGDIAYSPSYSDRNRFNPMVEIMNRIGYDALGAGNHEFQWEASKYGGPDGNPNVDLTDNMRELQRDTKFPVICANALEAKTGKRPDFLKPYIVKDVGYAKVGVVGIVTKDLATQAHPQVGQGWKIIDANKALDEVIPQMKADGAEVIVVLSHANLRDNKNMISKSKGVDMVIGAHDHQLVEEPIMVNDTSGKGVPLVEAGSHGYMVGKLNVKVDPNTKKVVRITSTLYPVLSSNTKPDPEISKIVEKWQGK